MVPLDTDGLPDGEFKPCACGCDAMTPAKFRPGHRAQVMDQRINHFFEGDVMAFVKWVDEQHSAVTDG